MGGGGGAACCVGGGGRCGMSLQPAAICSAFRMRSGCCRSLESKLEVWNVTLVIVVV